MMKQCLGCMELYDSEFDICPHCGYAEGTKAEESVHMEPGTILVERYMIGKVLGYGGFGVTYIAWDNKLEQKVAIKEYLPSEFSTRIPGEAGVTIFSGDRNEQFAQGLDKFVEEAKRLSKFQNEPGIVKIFDSFKANGTAYIVMEYLDGETLESYLEREGIVTEDQAIEMLLPILNSLQVVHKEGILHRDIAPENIFITKDGNVKLIDFGASRYATTSHSRSLTVIIKPGYSPEEQYRSRGDQGSHTDIYALAATLYKMVTGITPPDALERRALIETKRKDLLKDIHKVNKNISRNVENAILNAMNVQIEDRTPDIASFVGELNSEVPVKRRYGKIKKIDVYGWPLWLKITAPSVFVAFAVTGILLISGVIDFPSLFSDKVVVPEGMVIVPELEGMGKDEAIAEIEKLGLKSSADGNVESSYIDAGKIVLQTPVGGAYIEEGGTIVLTVSSGGGVVGPVNGISTVPYVVWDTEADAIAKMKKAGLGEPIIEYKEDATVEAGKVISQSVKENEKIKVGTQVTLVISSGKDGSGQGISGSANVDNLGGIIQSGTNVSGANKDFNYYRSGNEIIITGVSSSLAGEIIIPSEIDGYPVTKIGVNAFRNCSNLTGVTTPSSVKTIETHAFAYCASLKRIDIANGVTTIGDYAFASCTSLTSINIPSSVVTIGKQAFNSCTSLTSINIQGSVTQMGEGAFSGCPSVTNISIAKGITMIPKEAFWGCQSLVNIDIPDSVTVIGNNAFKYCYSLESVNIPSSVSRIGEEAFIGCRALKNVDISNGVTTIGKNAFDNCSSLTNIQLPSSVTTIESGAFMWSGLKSINISDNVIVIEENAFLGCFSMKVYFTSEAQKQKYASCFESDAQLIVQ